MSQEVDYSEVVAKLERIGGLRPEIKALRRAAVEKYGEELLGKVRGKIGGTGKVAGWQEKYPGSGGGYSAVRARAETYHKGYAVGYITNAIENGHRVSPPSGRAKRYRPQIRKAKVPGLGFYRASQPDAQALADRAAAELTVAIAQMVENA